MAALLAGADPNQTMAVVGMVDSQNTPVLFWLWPFASSHSILRLLLLAGANPNAKTPDGRTVPMIYIKDAFPQVFLVGGLFTSGPMPKPEEVHVALTELLIAGADPRIRDSKGHDLKDYINQIQDRHWRNQYLSLLQLTAYRTTRRGI
jgi:hypothetical protein